MSPSHPRHETRLVTRSVGVTRQDMGNGEEKRTPQDGLQTYGMYARTFLKSRA